MGCNAFLRLSLRILHRKSQGSEKWAWTVMTFPPWKSGTKASWVSVCWLIIARHLEEISHMQNTAESQPLLLFK
jgi:hypothetical protein